jgi:hypothetical protein
MKIKTTSFYRYLPDFCQLKDLPTSGSFFQVSILWIIYVSIYILKGFAFLLCVRKEKKMQLSLLGNNGNNKLCSVSSANRSLLVLNAKTAFAVLLSSVVTL